MSPWFTRKSGTLGSQGLAGSTTHRGGKRRPTSRRADRPEIPEIGEDRFGRNRVIPAGPARWLRKLVALIQFLLLAVLLVCAGYQSHYIFFKALYFRIQEISVEGTQELESQEVVALSGISLGDLFFKYNYERVKDRVRRHPRVKDVRVVVKSPNSIKLQVEEKEPRFYLQHGEEQLEIDENGVVLGRRERVEPLPLVRGAELADARPGEDAEGLIPEELEAELRLPDPEDPPLVSQPATDETSAEADPPLPSPPTPQLRVRHRKVLEEWVPALSKSPLKEYEAIDVANPHEIVVEWKGIKFLVSRVDRFRDASELIQPLLLEARNRGLEVARLDLRFPNPILKLEPKRVAPEGTLAGAVGIPTGDTAPTPAAGDAMAGASGVETAGTETAEIVEVETGTGTAGSATPVVEEVEEMDAEAFERLEVPAGEEPPPEAFIEETAIAPASESGPEVFESTTGSEPEHDLESFFGGTGRPEGASRPPPGWGRSPEGSGPAVPAAEGPLPPRARGRPDPQPWPPQARPATRPESWSERPGHRPAPPASEERSHRPEGFPGEGTKAVPSMDIPGMYPGGER